MHGPVVVVVLVVVVLVVLLVVLVVVVPAQGVTTVSQSSVPTIAGAVHGQLAAHESAILVQLVVPVDHWYLHSPAHPPAVVVVVLEVVAV